jgi:glycosyltransferase involved in cell wall biosynthesis
MNIGLFSPLPPSPTGVADYSKMLLEGLRLHAPDWNIEAYSDAEDDSDLAAAALPASSFHENKSNRSYLPVYHMGNSRHHDFIYPFLFRYPGVAVLHDLVLHHARLASYLKSPEVEAYRADMGNSDKRDRALTQMNAYTSEVEAAYPAQGAAVAEVALRMGGGRLLYEYPLHELVVRASKMTLVHSPIARERVLESCPDSTVREVRMGIEIPEAVDRKKARRRLGLSSGLILASFGLVTPEKRITTALRCLKRLLLEGVDAEYILVGDTVSHYDALEEARNLGVAHRVQLTGRVSEKDFRLHAFAADICLNLRYPSAGETSATLLRLLAAGRAVMVTDQIHYLDIPDGVVARVNLEGEEHGLYCDVMELVRHENERRRLEDNSRRFVVAEHSVDAMVGDTIACLEEAHHLPEPRVDLPKHLTST